EVAIREFFRERGRGRLRGLLFDGLAEAFVDVPRARLVSRSLWPADLLDDTLGELPTIAAAAQLAGDALRGRLLRGELLLRRVNGAFRGRELASRFGRLQAQDVQPGQAALRLGEVVLEAPPRAGVVDLDHPD